MAEKHPYISGSAGILQIINQLRKSFPASVTSDTLKKLGIAPNNETYALNILKFIGVLDNENKKIPAAGAVFNMHNEQDFQEGFSKLVEKSYHELFDLHGQDAWSLDSNGLITFFRGHDGTSDIVGRRQANTFQTLARVCGKVADNSPVPNPTKIAKPPKKVASPAKKTASPKSDAAKDSGSGAGEPPSGQKKGGDVALTVRIEINLPPGGDQATYDAIFKSIRENLMNGNGI
ncbi:DUF5343 domain-containing protein [Ralstonia sp. CHL-2022]|uniref:DUF5343 domain-containing protein n=1 Tax=Ralstonia mojiangensis TaxID=2953895 RepID=A0ABT2LAM9_9RALS|nr:DUF5343 domain-containing protein [Ralstonia mojiangensis]MCT7312406.1 DUF5343 domain-containing protein [Ralstonia mojiangensis]